MKYGKKVDSSKKRKETKETRSEKINGFWFLRAGHWPGKMPKQNLIKEMNGELRFKMEGSNAGFAVAIVMPL